MIVEIINAMGVVSYTRPHGHADVAEALRTNGYSVRFPGCNDMRLLKYIGCRDGVSYPVTMSGDGMVVGAIPLGRLSVQGEV